MKSPLSPYVSEIGAMHVAAGSGCPEEVKGQEEIRDGDAQEEMTVDDKKPEGEVGENVSEFQCMPCEDPEAIDEGVEVEAEVQRTATDPGQPTQSEKEEHDLTHFPFRPW